MIIDGKKIAQEILLYLKDEVQKLETKPTIAVIIVGQNPSSKIYVNLKQKKAIELGMNSIVVEMQKDTTQKELEDKIMSSTKTPK